MPNSTHRRTIHPEQQHALYKIIRVNRGEPSETIADGLTYRQAWQVSNTYPGTLIRFSYMTTSKPSVKLEAVFYVAKFKPGTHQIEFIAENLTYPKAAEVVARFGGILKFQKMVPAGIAQTKDTESYNRFEVNHDSH